MKRYFSIIVAAPLLIAMLAISNTVVGNGTASLHGFVSPPVTPIAGGKVRISVHRAEPKAPDQERLFVVFTLIDADGRILAQTDPIRLLPTATSFFDVMEPSPGGWPGDPGPAPVVALIRLVSPQTAQIVDAADYVVWRLTASVEVFSVGDVVVSLVSCEPLTTQ